MNKQSFSFIIPPVLISIFGTGSLLVSSFYHNFMPMVVINGIMAIALAMYSDRQFGWKRRDIIFASIGFLFLTIVALYSWMSGSIPVEIGIFGP